MNLSFLRKTIPAVDFYDFPLLSLENATSSVRRGQMLTRQFLYLKTQMFRLFENFLMGQLL
ncbi:unnamed protein product [Brassica napus]|uniref:(rape) hypothetical protein n=1 Tax=Brassica napus TaxID=3708 RepID=A0A816KNQ6_BRANA|nr:unnamed protein product [Brassica napus]